MDANVGLAINSVTEYAELGDRKIAYRSIGSGVDTVVLVNRFRGTLDTWDPLFLNLLARHYRVITFDYAGIGSSTGTLPTNISIVAKDIKDLSLSLGLNKIVVLGWSYGGLVAQAAVVLYPDLITHAVLIGTGPPGKREIPVEKAFIDRALKPVNDFDDEIVLFFEPDSEESIAAGKRSHERIAKRIDVSKIPSTEEVFELYFKGTAGFIEDKENFRERLKDTKIPILVISGDHDISFAVENWYLLIGRLKTAQLIMLPLTGHAPQHQFPELVAGYITSFLKYIK